MTREMIRDAIVRANRAGREGIEVIDFMEADTATASPQLALVTKMPDETTAAESPLPFE